MSAARPQFSIDDAFELSLEDAGPGPESSGVARFGPLHFERRARFEVADEDKQSRLRYQNLENDEDGTQTSPEPDGGAGTRSGPGTPSSSLCTIPQDAITTPIPKGPLAHLPLSPRRAHLSCRDSGRTSVRSSQWSFSTISSSTQHSYNACCSWTQHPLIQKNHRVVLASFLLLLLGLVLILTGVGLEVAPSPGVSSAIFFVPGFLLLVPGVYHVTFIYCAVKGHRGFQFFYLPYFEK
ncbi:transmembrane protein 134 isoform X1 [Phocoena sinus]|uniref:transmembrane protein 134 isoform X1 n=1 Tax=Phocoena sinus TaxID=42100 RepID=UPI0013C3FBD3|nr:transmembrane protein 134 isoform X1 [Phocoena sinus]